MSLSCSDLRDAFLQDELPQGPELVRHLDACSECRELCGEGAELGRGLSALVASEQSESDSLRLEPPSLAGEHGVRALLRSRPTYARVALLIALTALITGLSFALNGRDLRDAPMARVYGVVLVYFAGFWFAARRGLLGAAEPGYQHHVRALALASLAVPIAIALLGGSMSAKDGGPAAGLGCFVYGALLALPVVAAFFWLERADRPPAGAFWLVAALSGFTANLVLELHCPSQHLVHLLLGHASVGVVVLAAALAFRAARGMRES
ncbi:MAG TPA: hypothetical protein VGI10_11830 [Polyangiaceae bacterium]|jgi:hypothetical protein